MRKTRQPSADFDNPWKEMLDKYFRQFMLMFFPAVHDEIDWDQGYELLEQELNRIAASAKTGKRFVDKLVKVCRKDGTKTYVYIHIEVQSQKDHDLPKRVYVYHSLIFLRFGMPVMSLVVLGDDIPDWQPSHFGYNIWGCELSLTYQTVKLLDYANRTDEWKESRNPFALFVLAHLKTLETGKDPQKRFHYKEAVTKELLDFGMPLQDVQTLFKCIDALMSLPKELELEYLERSYAYQEEKKMPFLAPFEIIMMEKGILQGRQEGKKEGKKEGIWLGSLQEAQNTVLDILSDEFGNLPAPLVKSVHSMKDVNELRNLRKQALKVKSLEEFKQLLQ